MRNGSKPNKLYLQLKKLFQLIAECHLWNQVTSKRQFHFYFLLSVISHLNGKKAALMWVKSSSTHKQPLTHCSCWGLHCKYTHTKALGGWQDWVKRVFYLSVRGRERDAWVNQGREGSKCKGPFLAKAEVLLVGLGMSLCRGWSRPTVNYHRGWHEPSSSHSCGSYKKLWRDSFCVLKIFLLAAPALASISHACGRAHLHVTSLAWDGCKDIHFRPQGQAEALHVFPLSLCNIQLENKLSPSLFSFI